MPAISLSPTSPSADPLWNPEAFRSLIDRLWALRKQLIRREAAGEALLRRVADTHRASARNLLHYLELRKTDLRPIQEQLASLGISSLGRAESNVLANLDKVLVVLHRLLGESWADQSCDVAAGLHMASKLLNDHTRDLLGDTPIERKVRIMVTLPSEAARDPEFVHQLVAAGIDVARINCAHDDAEVWTAMAVNVKRAARKLGRSVRILMDLGGPKLRTGQMPAGPAVVKLRPARDELGRVTAPGLLGLRADGSLIVVPGASVHVGVKAKWLASLRTGDWIDLVDARKAHRKLRVVAVDDAGALVRSDKTVYLLPQTILKQRRNRKGPKHTRLSDLANLETRLLLHRGDRLRVTSQEGKAAEDTVGPLDPVQLSVPCTLPEVFMQVREGEHIWFDDGRIGGVVRSVSSDALEVEITQARDEGERLGSDKGINLPDSALKLPAMTEKDVADLVTVSSFADMVGLSFVQTADDVEALRQRLAELDAPHLSLVLKIETRRAFENLPELLFSAMRSPSAGIMIARGDLAVECGYERLAEVQEEILWAAEAAHIPVIWATQVLETLAKTGLPSRAEITDAAMGERAECVMLNKGSHILDAIHTLDDILRRMQSHQHKKRALMRPLKAWDVQKK